MSSGKIANLRSRVDILHEATSSDPGTYSTDTSRVQLFDKFHPCEGCDYAGESCQPNCTIGVSDSGYAEIIVSADGLIEPQQLSTCVTRIAECAVNIGNEISSSS